MADNEQQSAPEGSEGEQPGKKETDSKYYANPLLNLIGKYIESNRTQKEDVMPEKPHTPDVLGAIRLTEIDPGEIPFKQEDGVGLTKVNLETGEAEEMMTAYGELDKKISIGKRASVDYGSYRTGMVMACFRDEEGNVYVRTFNSLYRLDAVELAPKQEPLPFIDFPRELQFDDDKPMPSISDVVAENARKREEEKNGETDIPSN